METELALPAAIFNHPDDGPLVSGGPFSFLRRPAFASLYLFGKRPLNEAYRAIYGEIDF